MNNKISNICLLCNEKVKKFDNNNNGFMEVCKHEYHFVCVEKYGYQKFCREIMIYIKENEQIEKPQIINKYNK